MTAARTLLYCRCIHTRRIASETREAVLGALARSALDFIAAADLCGCAARRSPFLARAAACAGVRIAACHERAVRALFDAGRAPLSVDAVVLNMRSEPADRVVAGLEVDAGAAGTASAGGWGALMTSAGGLDALLYEGAGAQPLAPDFLVGLLGALLDAGLSVMTARSFAAVPANWGAPVIGRFEAAAAARISSGAVDVANRSVGEIVDAVVRMRQEAGDVAAGAWLPWFPVVDAARCTCCGRCADFCLFSVYAKDGAGRVEVAAPRQCKTNCPACARVCPSGAIIFPKAREEALSGGEPGAGADAVKALVQGDVHAALRRRGRRFGAVARAGGAWECECMEGLGAALDIPSEVMASLTGEDLARIAARYTRGGAVPPAPERGA